VKAALLCGPCPPGACGVGDYTYLLARALNQKGVDAHVISTGNWNLPGVIKRYERSGRAKFDVVHIQYPTVGFGGSLNAQGLALLQRCVITLHETSRAHIFRKLALLPFSIRPKRLVFPSEYERQFAVKWAPWISRVSCVIPVPSNISEVDGKSNRSLDEILYFGLIMPKKGLESVIALAELVKASGLSFRIRIMGSCPLKHAAYFEALKSKTSTLPIIWDNEHSEQQVAKRLASSSIAYLPYPDGVSERRATFKAALLNGVTVITTRGQHTPSSLEGLVSFCASPEEALVAAQFLIGNAERRAKLADKASHYARQFTWDSIAETHLALYKDILGAESSCEQISLQSPELDNRLDSKSV
jgi:glycosyltransferase involved in cell wall biosynthesis